MMNIDRVFIPIDDEEIQNKVKVSLIEAIVCSDILDYGCDNLICDAWDEKEGKMGKALTGEQILRVRIMAKEKE